MGGVAKHLNHLYDNRALTYNKLAKILSLASNGELVGTEKTDGFNIYLGMRGDEATAARNKGDMSRGGMNVDALAAREFKGGPVVRKAYLDAFDAYEASVKSLSAEEQNAIFGADKEIFYNSEIMGPGASNVVNYDVNMITIHHVNHKMFNHDTNKMEVVDTKNNDEVLDKIIDRFEEATAGKPFSVQKTAFLRLKRLDNDSDLKIALERIKKAGFEGDMTIQDYLNLKIFEQIKNQVPYFSDSVIQDLSDRILKKTEHDEETGKKRILYKNVKEIYKGFPPDQVQLIREIVGQEKQYIANAIWPIEEAIHDFSVEILRGMESAYILDNQTELSRLQNEIKDAVVAIQRYEGEGHSEAKDVLYKQLQKIKHHDNINTTVEGFVFEFEGMLYKFTGNFAPINQILGLFRYGRGSVPPIRSTEQLNEVETFYRQPGKPMVTNRPSRGAPKKYVILIPGGFKPPHAGHYNLVKQYAEHPSVEKVIILMGDKARTDVNKTVSIDFEKARQLWIQYGITEGQNVTFVKARTRTKLSPKKGEETFYENPTKDVYDFVQEVDQQELQGLTIALGASDKADPESGVPDSMRAVQFAKLHKPMSGGEHQGKLFRPGIEVDLPPFFVEARTFSYPAESANAGKELSARIMREAIAAGNVKEFYYHLPAHVQQLPDQRITNLMNMLHNVEAERPNYEDAPSDGEDPVASGPTMDPGSMYRSPAGVSESKELFKIVEETIDELSAMGAPGGIEGHASSRKKKKEVDEEIDEMMTPMTPSGGTKVIDPTGIMHLARQGAQEEELDEEEKETNSKPKHPKTMEENELIDEVADYLLKIGAPPIFMG